jgi:hypothetical protein
MALWQGRRPAERGKPYRLFAFWGLRAVDLALAAARSGQWLELMRSDHVLGAQDIGQRSVIQ